jgi:hypothetical protein
MNLIFHYLSNPVKNLPVKAKSDVGVKGRGNYWADGHLVYPENNKTEMELSFKDKRSLSHYQHVVRPMFTVHHLYQDIKMLISWYKW